MRPALTRHLTDIVPFAHALLQHVLQPGDVAIDATAGNGYDTLLLAQWVGDGGRIYAFDVQAQAIEATRERLQAHGLADRVSVIHAGHETVLQHVTQPVQAAVFNLGYLPRSDKQITTQADSTIAALQGIWQLLRPHGVIVLVVYHGPAGGKQERSAVEDYVCGLDPAAVRVVRFALANVPNDPPYVLALEKLEPFRSDSSGRTSDMQ